jgi:hypothetical protein
MGGRLMPYSGAGGSRPSQKSWRTNCTGSQPTEASMLKPMISKATRPQKSEMKPVQPR